ncbi:hypothetical protein Fmac_007164 [Flemingia macrophylla]|uniref:Uncharacterized protein n=1 Tax=Flemingia macrophylla TaxID=520843 RepID=A0ABD1NCN4_9FABA
MILSLLFSVHETRMNKHKESVATTFEFQPNREEETSLVEAADHSIILSSLLHPVA